MLPAIRPCCLRTLRKTRRLYSSDSAHIAELLVFVCGPSNLSGTISWPLQTTRAWFYDPRTRGAMQTCSECPPLLPAASTWSLLQEGLHIGADDFYNGLHAFYVPESFPFDEGNETRPVSAPTPNQTTHPEGSPPKTAPASFGVDLFCFHRYHQTPDRPIVISEVSCDCTLRVDDATPCVDVIQ
ncbi:hypothetical protein AURDEDRAFT_165811 [Auricularia subglabra TFB-10046 SS5]|nr:hypothetical protein AURDEDRAFT_165811 [Auricularia subglabra TFB-10046 SS5]